MKHPLVRFAFDLSVRTLIAFAIGFAVALVLIMQNGKGYQHDAALIAGKVTIFAFIMITSWWLPRMMRSENT